MRFAHGPCDRNAMYTLKGSMAFAIWLLSHIKIANKNPKAAKVLIMITLSVFK